ncbi:helix-turn-helix domain-containing protein [Aquimarina longa]|uniref:helix-turn-helix domain-containing protein n=1 Tax=Aquimarina longa TaxID=1080221 RepID=UPI0009EA4ABF|nr:helix-turn-helix domain-containing protein [Aquimarina longa]
MELLTTTSEEIISFFNTAKIISEELKKVQKNYRPLLNDEHYLIGEEVCELLHISSRTLQYYRDDKLLPYIQIQGKILYKESDIINLLEANYQ